jgi:RNA polymerase sigma factor (sigma-70 family)
MPELQDTFQTPVDRHKNILYKVCNSYCRNPDDREDLAQQIVAQLWQSFRSFDGRVQFSTWMYRVALNVAISWFRREKTRTSHILSADERLLDVAAETEPEPDDIRLLYQFIETLDELNKALIFLCLDGHTNRQIGEVLGISETNVGTKIGRLKTSMRQEFKGIGGLHQSFRTATLPGLPLPTALQAPPAGPRCASVRRGWGLT